MSRQDEYNLQVQVIEYLKIRYPNVLFRSDLIGVRLTIGQAKKVKKIQNGRGWPDLFIAEPRGGYTGLFLELKATFGDLYTKQGQLRETKRIQEQHQVLAALTKRGYRAVFAAGFDEARRIIDDYLSLESSGLARQ